MAGPRAMGLGAIIAGIMAVSAGATPAQHAAMLSGGRSVHVLRAGDSLATLGARFGVEPRVIARVNSLPPSARLRAGQWIVVENHHIVPEPEYTDEIVINLPQRMLFQFLDGQFVAAYPVAVGKASWRTFIGAFSVTVLETDPVWDVPLSIQDEQRLAGRTVQTRVPPGPSNPLGKHWIGLDRPGFGIHGTNAPGSIYGYRTHGCIRLHPEDAAALYAGVRLGTRGRIVYEPVMLVQIGTQILLEVHPDPYHKQPDALHAARDLAAHQRLAELIAWDMVAQVVRERDGVPVDVAKR